MNKKISVIILVVIIITVIPTSYAQFTIGEQANQKLIEVTINGSEKIKVKHVVSGSNVPVSVNLFKGEISNLKVTDDNGNEKMNDGLKAGIVDDGYGNESVFLFPSNQNSIIEYDLEDISTLYDNLWTVRIAYPQEFSILFSENINMIFVNENLIHLKDKKGINVNGGGTMVLQYYSDISKIVKQIQWEENYFDVEIITNSIINNFNFEQESKSISFETNEKNKFVTIMISEELLGGPYVVLLGDEKLKYSKYFPKENHVSLTMKPESTDQITIIGTTVIPEFSMFIPLIMGFLVVLTVPFMKKFNLH
jgi:hypothetical protein